MTEVPEPDAAEPEAVEETPEATTEETPEEPQQYGLKRWTFALILAAVWIPAAAIGLGLYYWWYHDLSLHKTMPVFVVLVVIVVCTIAAMLVAMVDGKPLVAAVAIALISAPFAATAAAAVLHGLYFCDLPTVKRCLVGLIPY